ncbi:NADH-ubiquinone oxidoreductase 29.9 kd subunit precursor [Westerdykella ornata]|uniref:NADH-ubiquinone oxidoreductase 29.9 kd subunit n=1 Tax=Westerdykella ornata TaxID=318751 RepID=A0A6A6JG38_WESOR|nr:NADH-ubiquinone oxidoreductase 29.9 kd subunit precursor [Westerdykella ornata]KAF2275600.1 NADH-ubiquinone oxidoreductase 29.9 kd subunit precursor [Westerdykella ornata]
MRAASRLLAAVKEQYLEAGAPTGLTGLLTHPTPRSTLLYLYSSTLDKLQKIPENSVYRQATEALTKHRLAIIEAAKPKGLEEWQQQVQYQISEHPKAFEVVSTSAGQHVRLKKTKRIVDFRSVKAEWNGEEPITLKEGIQTVKARKHLFAKVAGGKDYNPADEIHEVKLPLEPQLTAEQISEVESQIGAGLIEEVIQVAEGEHKLVDVMIENKVWEALEEQAPEGQWTYFERGGHTKTGSP